jgi:hypothetical protein
VFVERKNWYLGKKKENFFFVSFPTPFTRGKRGKKEQFETGVSPSKPSPSREKVYQFRVPAKRKTPFQFALEKKPPPPTRARNSISKTAKTKQNSKANNSGQKKKGFTKKKRKKRGRE